MSNEIQLQRDKLNIDLAALAGVSSFIHPDDHIYNFLINHPGFDADQSRINYYFVDGKKSASQLDDILIEYLPAVEQRSLFEFASGYGCVTRHLVKDESLQLTSCDIHPQAIAFLREKIGAAAVQSASIPEDLDPGDKFDAVFALSFFSHMPITTWSRWLVRLTQITKPGGVVVFTTQGLKSVQFLGMAAPDDEFQYRFKRSSEQIDIPVEEYGQMVVTPEFVERQIATLSGVSLLEKRISYWWGHQDLYILRKV